MDPMEHMLSIACFERCSYSLIIRLKEGSGMVFGGRATTLVALSFCLSSRNGVTACIINEQRTILSWPLVKIDKDWREQLTCHPRLLCWVIQKGNSDSTQSERSFRFPHNLTLNIMLERFSLHINIPQSSPQHLRWLQELLAPLKAWNLQLNVIARGKPSWIARGEPCKKQQ